jgi:hypothetical protein
MEVQVSRKDAINKEATSDRQRKREDESAIGGNVRRKGQDPSPDDRERGEISDAEPQGAVDVGGTRRS